MQLTQSSQTRFEMYSVPLKMCRVDMAAARSDVKLLFEALSANRVQIQSFCFPRQDLILVPNLNVTYF